ncbi:hypothetical protein MNBD_ALPHA02-2396 [hydrothermal vent metagenome]|uniref:Uncharacterized protein n=1 Tax=hydrothermal vent metagenome TaxID=652676 RepID=A0A3B0S692_9ZZZZ
MPGLIFTNFFYNTVHVRFILRSYNHPIVTTKIPIPIDGSKINN